MKCESYQSVFIKNLKEKPVILGTYLCWQQNNSEDVKAKSSGYVEHKLSMGTDTL